MFLLTLDILDQGVLVIRGMRECPVAILPMRECLKNMICLYPLGCTDLDILDYVCETNGGMQIGENVKMIRCAPYSIQVAFLVIDDSPNVTG